MLGPQRFENLISQLSVNHSRPISDAILVFSTYAVVASGSKYINLFTGIIATDFQLTIGLELRFGEMRLFRDQFPLLSLKFPMLHCLFVGNTLIMSDQSFCGVLELEGSTFSVHSH